MKSDLYKEIYENALALQKKENAIVKKDEKDYAFTFVYPPNQVLTALNKSPYESLEAIENANLYVHIPFCTGKCTYCYFGCYPLASSPMNKVNYIEYLKKEMQLLNAKYGKINLISIHFGGGTPTTLSDSEINLLFSYLYEYFNIEKGIEITFESSPETLTGNKIKTLMNNGVNRLNIGIQTLNDDLLKSINRRHNAETAINAVKLAKNLGLTNINVDLMYGLKNQTVEDFKDTLNKIYELGIQSISTYRLRIHPNGKIKDQIEIFNEERALEMYITMMEMMEEKGYYQCSSHKFAIKEEFAQEQIINKRGIKKSTLLPLGMAAYGYIGDTLFWNERKMEDYKNKLDNYILPYSIGFELNKTEKKAKACVLGIHNVRGINLTQYKESYGEEIQNTYGPLIEKLEEQKLIKIEDNRLVPTKLGMVFGDEIAILFYSEDVKNHLIEHNKKYGIFFDDILN